MGFDHSRCNAQPKESNTIVLQYRTLQNKSDATNASALQVTCNPDT